MQRSLSRMHNAPTRVLIVEDNTLMRTELQALFGQDPRFGEVHAASNFSNALSLAGQPCDVVLLDLQLPDGNGLELIPVLRAAQPNIKFLVFSVFADEAHTLQAIESGVDGYVVKDDPDLPGRVIEIMAGQHPLDARVAGHVIARLAVSQPAPGLDLTPRERQTLGGLYRGMTYAEIAQYLNVSNHTVPGYIKNLYRKLGVTSRSQAVFKATQLGLIGERDY